MRVGENFIDKTFLFPVDDYTHFNVISYKLINFRLYSFILRSWLMMVNL